MPPKKEHDDWFRSFGIDPDAYLIDKDATAAAAKGADATALRAKIEAALTEFDAQSKRLKDAGSESRFMDKQIAAFHSQYDALNKPGKTTRPDALLKFEGRLQAALAESARDAQAQLASGTKGSGAAAHELYKGAATHIASLKDPGQQKTLDERRTALVRELEAAEAIADPAKQKAAIAAADKVAQVFLKEVVEAAANGKTDKEKAAINLAIQETYRAALQDKFGIVVSDPAKTVKTAYLEKVYNALEKVPVDNVVHDKLTSLAFDPKTGPSGAYNAKTIVVGQFTEKSGSWPYIEPEPDGPPDADAASQSATPSGNAAAPKSDKKKKGETINADRMSAVVLHELGHSIDTRWGIMDDASAPTRGAWGSASPGEIAPLLAAELVAKVDKELVAFEADLTKALSQLLSSGKVDLPPSVAALPSAAKVTEFFRKCDLRLRYKLSPAPWDDPWPFGDRCYHEAAPGRWVSYSMKARSGPMTVSKYQWRTCREWFAELYAFTYVQQRKAPSGVDAKAASYMFQGA